MKRIVDGVEVDLEPIPGVEITELPDRMIVKGPDGAFSAVAVRVGEALHVSYRGRVHVIEKPGRRHTHAAATSGEIRAPMPGQIVDVMVSEGQAVKKGDRVLVLEAMKTQQVFSAPFDGTVAHLRASKGKQVAEGEALATIEPAE